MFTHLKILILLVVLLERRKFHTAIYKTSATRRYNALIVSQKSYIAL